MPTVLNALTVSQIKRRIWDGESQHYVAADIGVTQPTISRIVNGEQWFEVKWPDGSMGGLSTDRRLELQREKLNKQKHRTVPTEEVEDVEELGENIIDLAKRRVSRVTEEEEERHMREALADFGKTNEEFRTAAINLQDLPVMWDLFKQAHPGVPLIDAADKSPDQTQKSVVMYVLGNLTPDMWDSDTAYRLVREALELIKKG